jgi:hypothetical protein
MLSETARRLHDQVCNGAVCVNVKRPQSETGKTVQDMVNEIEILRARAERYRRLANDLFDRRTSAEAASIAQELDAEAARLMNQVPSLH